MGAGVFFMVYSSHMGRRPSRSGKRIHEEVELVLPFVTSSMAVGCATLRADVHNTLVSFRR